MEHDITKMKQKHDVLMHDINKKHTMEMNEITKKHQHNIT